ncbi:MAG: DNA pilot protein [Microvirus sp.]|nr:MAG: DNA pilot protein [Microvirus sp.]
MGIDLNPFAPLIDLAGGIVSANQARSAFKSRYQDTVADMKKAGLNPALAYGQGGGNPQTVPLPNLGESINKSAQAGASAKQSSANAELIKAQTDLLRAQAADLSRRPLLENLQLQAQTGLTAAQTGVAGAQQLNIGSQTDLNRLRSVGENLENTNRQIQNDLSALDLAIRQVDQQYQSRTLEDRIQLIHKAVTQAGLNISATDIANYLANKQKPMADLRAQGATAATDFQNWWGKENEREAGELDAVSDAAKNFVNRIHRAGIRGFNKLFGREGVFNDLSR